MGSCPFPVVALLWCALGQTGASAEKPREISLDRPEVRANRVRLLKDKAVADKEAAWAIARRQGWSPRIQRGEIVAELTAITRGRPCMYETANQNAAISTAADLVRNTAPYNVNGSGVLVGIWDAGSVLATHQELIGRVFDMDVASTYDHSTHVAGTVGAAGVVLSAMGMAPSASIDSYDWNNDVAEMTGLAMAVPGEAGKIQISNHSYTYVEGWDRTAPSIRWWGVWGERESAYFGQYGDVTSQWDQLCYAAPYFLAFKAVGNDRDDAAPGAGVTFEYWWNGQWNQKAYDPATDPYADYWDNGGFDTITTVGVAKNIMTVGAVNDAISGGTRDVSQAGMSAFSGWGPADDGRIKPDIVADGINLYSCVATGDKAYASMSGTSMATANASGSAALLVDYYGRLFPGQYMRASTLKGLIIHTADDLDNPGPDYRTGWGLMNTQAAAELLRRQQRLPQGRRLVEGLLNAAITNGAYAYKWDGVHPIRATLCWTDPAASPLTGLDNPSLRLVNDLDLRVTGPDGTTVYYPYVLDPLVPANPAMTGDNVLDNVEQVYVALPAGGTYTVQVSYKGTLLDGQQGYSLLVSGVVANVVGDFDNDEDVDTADVQLWEACASGPGVPIDASCQDKDLDGDGDADQADFGLLQHCYSGENGPIPVDCVK